MENHPVIRTKGISPVWVLPVLALAICLWILYTSIQNAGVTIEVSFEDASGITPGKTQVVIRGIPIGTVTKISPDLNNRRIKTTIRMDKSVTDQLVEDTLFWVVRPEITAGGIQGLDTLLGGSYIGIQPGQSTTSARTFTGVPYAPPISEDTPGLHLQLRASELNSIQAGSGIYYKNIRIGSVTKTGLPPEGDNIIINLFVRQEYAHLVRQGSRFCNASGLSISGKLTDLKLHLESLSSLLKGGIVLYTPKELTQTRQAENGQTFTLYDDLESARYSITVTLQLASSDGITEGSTQVIYRGIVAGFVKKIAINHDENHTVTAQIMLDPRVQSILCQGTKFWIVRPSITTSEVKNLDTLVTGPYITFSPGNGPFQDHFEILPEPPAQSPLRKGSEFLLSAKDTYGVNSGTPLTYKGKKVGEVLDIMLNDTGDAFKVPVYIYRPYERLLQANSVFWYHGGISFDASLSGIKLKSTSLVASIQGEIAFITPEQTAAESKIDRHDVIFPLYEDYETAQEASPQLQPRGYRIQLTSTNAENIKKDTPLFYKNIRVGQVTKTALSEDNQTILLTCFIDERYRNTVNRSSRFYNLSGVRIHGSIQGVELETAPLEAIVAGGIGYYTPNDDAGRKAKSVFPLYTSYLDSQTPDHVSIHVRFKDCDNLQIGSPVKYKGIIIGEVAGLQFAKDLDAIDARLLIKDSAEPFFRTGTKVWMEDAQVSLSGVENIKSLIFGPFISILPGEGELNTVFIALPGRPDIAQKATSGLNVVLSSKHLGSLKINSPVYYRQVKIGRILHYSLSDNFQEVLITINIEEPYTALIRENSKFWTVSGTRIKGGLFSGITVSTESLEAMLTGGIALATPNNGKMGVKVMTGHRFRLHDNVKPEWLDWEPDITLVKKEKQQEK